MLPNDESYETINGIVNPKKQQNQALDSQVLGVEELNSIRSRVNAIGRPFIKKLYEANKSHSFKSRMIEFECFAFAVLIWQAQGTGLALPMHKYCKTYFTKTVSSITTGGVLGDPVYEYVDENYIHEKTNLFIKDVIGLENGYYPKYTKVSIVVKPLCNPSLVYDMLYATNESDDFLQWYKDCQKELVRFWNDLKIG